MGTHVLRRSLRPVGRPGRQQASKARYSKGNMLQKQARRDHPARDRRLPKARGHVPPGHAARFSPACAFRPPRCQSRPYFLTLYHKERSLMPSCLAARALLPCAS